LASRISRQGGVIQLRTARLTISRLAPGDAPFIHVLLNEPSFIRFIGDKGIDTLEDARTYLRDGPIAHYGRHGFGLCRVALQADATPVGICGLVKREAFPHPDLGFAFLCAHWSRGYAHEASLAVLDEARDRFGLRLVLAMADAENHASTRLLRRLGFRFECDVTMPGETKPVQQFAIDL